MSQPNILIVYTVRYIMSRQITAEMFAESRGHVFAKSLDGEGGFRTSQAKKGRVHHECVFCGAVDNLTRVCGEDLISTFERRNDGVVVTDVINSDVVRSEAEIRNISVSHFKVGQENES